MIKIYSLDDVLVLEYWADMGDTTWARTQLRDEGIFSMKRTFTFTPEDLLNEEERDKIMADSMISSKGDPVYEHDEFDNVESIAFKLGEIEGDYFVIQSGKVTSDVKVYLHKDIKFDVKLFVSQRNISVFSKLEKYIGSDIFIGGDHEDNIPEEVMWDLIKRFPNSREKDLYEAAVISSIIREYVEYVPDYLAKYERYLNRKAKVRSSDLQEILEEQELRKYKMILDKLNLMLRQESTYSEAQWQEEILGIITLLYPKYIHAFKNVTVKRKNDTALFLDILLLDSGGYVDIIEINKPFESAVVSKNTYRNNHIPYKELAGTVMQIEKYIYYLNRWGADGEAEMSKKLDSQISGIEVKLTNPGGLIIMGRDHNLSPAQKSDFEVVKRKYKNIMDILTYDELIRRLEFTIKLWEAQGAPVKLNASTT
ncbi:DUF4263 domain-containing protein [Pedobacter petrophilus]|uniref:DUF4263 domain-containing protein n=1 Tax=Pedobacter petrophilus TaxID=1908241 RepID=A0A7K0G4I8_9SPHI|nr:Shedu immune nuclease family protein [Pedobacter petrophilus]MRX78552.1 DUF4263 domain-containing protein [Pedobacter petrophilus]